MRRGWGSPYEVRCARCDVSFPVETRRCIHCGGPTAASDAPVGTGADFPGPIEVMRTGPSPATAAPSPLPAPVSSDRLPPFPGPIGESEPADEARPGLGATLLRSFGSLFWIIALIGFSIVRSCSEN